jgi:HlyD family secretion protein
MRHARRIAILLVLLTGAVGGAFWFGWLPVSWRAGVAGQGQKTLADDPADQGKIHILGWLEPACGFVDINGIPGDRLETLLVTEDAPVTKGQSLAYLESRTLKQLQLDTLKTQVQEAVARREAEIQLAESRILTAKLGIEKVKLQESEAESLQEKIKLLEDNLAMAEKDYNRMHELRNRPQAAALSDQVVSEQEIDRQRLVVHRAKAELSAAKADARQLQATQSLAAKAAEADLKVTMASKDAAAAAVPLKSLLQKEELARVELSMTEIKSPCDGRVMKVFMRAGETVSQKPILRMANLDLMVALAEVYEVDIKRVHVAQTATIRSKAFHAPKDKDGLRGKVVQISRIVNTPELKSLNPFAKADRHVISIRIEIAKDDCPVAAQFVDMQVDVELHGADAARYPSDSPKKSIIAR